MASMVLSKDNMVHMTSEKFWMCGVNAYQSSYRWEQVLCVWFYLHKEDISGIGGQLSVLANLKLDGFCCNYKWHSYLQWKCTLWDGAKPHHQGLRNTGWEGQRRGKSQRWQQCYQPKWCFLKKNNKKISGCGSNKYILVYKFHFHEFIFGLVKVKLVITHQKRYWMEKTLHNLVKVQKYQKCRWDKSKGNRDHGCDSEVLTWYKYLYICISLE